MKKTNRSPIHSAILALTMSSVNYVVAGMLRGLLYPILLLGAYVQKRREAGRQGYRSIVPEPYLLKRSRTRALTLPLPSRPRNRQRTSDQWQCDLLKKLPLEIRQIIWKMCLGGMKLHVDIRNRRLQYHPCSSPNPSLCYKTCWALMARPSGGPNRQLLALLLSCRQVYSEAIHFLYSNNSFDTIFPEFIAYLPGLVLPQRFSAIRSVHLQWTFDLPPQLPPYGRSGPRHDDMMWVKVWSTLTQMKGLTELRVEIRIPEGSEWALPLWAEKEVDVLRPLREVEVAGNFELILPFPSNASDTEMEGLPCQIQRTGKP
ncbi:hypothetical protein F4781DRAFT_402525 [Annulohypoxylon bovei var. microspora]|nr:hypothetical protein F4781DRAFT_402525 [Annulohypoxylon bovei var. microspora]